ncbi:hypothetical protein ACE01N_19840 [Saccharicrinis sp. FJH2]|uniref:hypothetical protein n=1 Tax=Saccharicrinis sp. FJH65 TaxID=3344659 RepID=UPI0035F364B4
MRHSAYILAILIISYSCKNSADKQVNNEILTDSLDSKTEINTNTASETTQAISKDTISIREFAQLILDDKVKPSDNEETFKCLEKLMSDDKKEREYYFQVYRKISRQADGALSEVLGGYIKTFFELNPDFCLSQYMDFDNIEKNIMIDNIAFEFYASGIDYENDIDSYFQRTTKRLQSNSKEYKNTLSEIKTKVSDKVAEIND